MCAGVTLTENKEIEKRKKIKFYVTLNLPDYTIKCYKNFISPVKTIVLTEKCLS